MSEVQSSTDESPKEDSIRKKKKKKKTKIKGKEELFVGQIKIDTITNKWQLNLVTNETNIVYKIDTGADANVISYEDYKSLKIKPKLKPTKMRLTAYNNTPIPVKGKCILYIRNLRMKKVPILFIVADTDSTPIIGHESSAKLHLICKMFEVKSEVPDYVKQYEDCFGDLGCLSTIHHIDINKRVSPVIHPPRKVPYARLVPLKEELDRMERLGVIVPVNEHTEWASSLVIVEKPGGKLRVCMDPKDLNKAIKRQNLELPTTEEILDKMAGSKYFTKLDASNAYWQMKVDEETSKLLVFNSPYGRYRYLRVPYGIRSASEMCQQEISKIINGTESMNSQDDIIIWGTSKKELRDRSHKVFEAISKSGLKLNKSKCQFEMTEIKFLGHKISANGIEADPEKITAITKMPNPTSVKELQRFLGITNYLSKFIPNYSNITAPLRQLLEKSVQWSFEKPQEEAIQALKKIITNKQVLKFYDQTLSLRICSDASMQGLGAVLEQKSREDQ